MNCWHCNHELTWGCDYDLEEGYDPRAEEFSMHTILHCGGCGSLVEVYYPKENDNEND